MTFCETYNPFYSENLYYTQEEVDGWKDNEGNVLTRKDYDDKLIDAFVCEHLKETE